MSCRNVPLDRRAACRSGWLISLGTLFSISVVILVVFWPSYANLYQSSVSMTAADGFTCQLVSTTTTSTKCGWCRSNAVTSGTTCVTDVNSTPYPSPNWDCSLTQTVGTGCDICLYGPYSGNACSDASGSRNIQDATGATASMAVAITFSIVAFLCFVGFLAVYYCCPCTHIEEHEYAPQAAALKLQVKAPAKPAAAAPAAARANPAASV